jgi:hypothetical protein
MNDVCVGGSYFEVATSPHEYMQLGQFSLQPTVQQNITFSTGILAVFTIFIVAVIDRSIDRCNTRCSL